MYIIVDRLASFDRFSVPFEKSSYHLYGKSIIDVPDKLGVHLLNTLKRAGYSTSIYDDIKYLQVCVYSCFNTIRRHMKTEENVTLDDQMNDTKFDLSVYKCIEAFFKIFNFEYLYSNPQLKWIEVCGYIQNEFKNYYLLNRDLYEYK